MAVKPSWDIFCKIVDNFGDIGVCWRLAKQLAGEHGLQVRLLVDDLVAAQTIIPSLDLVKTQQHIDAINIIKWDANTDLTYAAEVVIEGFSCALPVAYMHAMLQKKSKWVNLEYLSAEPWVAGFHGIPSPQQNGLKRYFYFPGFSEATGGLIRECHIKPLHDNVSAKQKLTISLFCYPHAPIEDLLAALSAHKDPIDCYVPTSSTLPKIAAFFAQDTIDIGETLRYKNLNLHILPFLSQPDYDQLLNTCDLNFVRGEDSWVRAIWAGKPFIWQPYLQADNTHITKLQAFLADFYTDFTEKNLVCEAHGYWSSEHLPQSALQAYLNVLPNIKNDNLQRTNLLKKQADLATKLVDFCNKI